MLDKFERIHEALLPKIDNIHVEIPGSEEVPNLSYLKRYEDAIDALICGWVGICYLKGQAIPYGDQHAAIWVPQAT